MGIKELAKKYLELGWSIIPIKPKDKKPAIASWEEFQTRRPTEAEVEEWFDNEDRNIALICGAISGVDVVDVDSYKNKENGLNLETPIKVTTPRGGEHLYFKHRDGVRPGVNADIGVDLRADASYVLLPPSLGSNGNKYKWKTGGKKLPDIIGDLPIIPIEVVEKIKKGSEALGEFKLEDAMNLTEGERNSQWHKAAVSLISKHGEDLAWKLLVAMNNEYDPPMPEKEMVRTFQSAQRFVQKNPPKKVAQEIGGWVEPTLDEDLERVKSLLKEGKQAGYPTGFPGFDDITGGLIPGQSYLFFGDTNTGKSVLMLNIMMHLSSHGIRCLLFDLENPYVMTAERQLLVAHRGALTREMWKEKVQNKEVDDYINMLKKYPMRVYDINKMNDRFGEITFDGVEKVMEEAVAQGAQVIGIDHLHYFEPSEKNYNELANIARRINDFCAKHNVVVLLVAHTRKGLLKAKNNNVSVNRPTLDDIAGGGLISRHTKNATAIQRNQAGSRDEQREAMLFVDKTKAGPTGKVKLEFDPETLVFTPVGNNATYRYNPMEVLHKVKEVEAKGKPLDNLDEIM